MDVAVTAEVVMAMKTIVSREVSDDMCFVTSCYPKEAFKKECGTF